MHCRCAVVPSTRAGSWASSTPSPIRPQCCARPVRVIDDDGRVGLLAYVAERAIAEDDAPRGNHFQRADQLDRAVSEAGFLVVDRIEGSGLPDAPVDWQLRQERVERELEEEHGHDAVWRTAAEQSSRFVRLLAGGALSLTLIHAVAV